MKRVLQHFSVGVALLALAVVPSLYAQQADQDSSPNAPAKTNPAVPQAQQN